MRKCTKYKMKLLHKRKKIMEQYLCGNRNRFRGVVVDAKMNKTLIHLALTATSAAAETSFAWVDTTAVSSIVVLVVLVRKWRTIRLHTHTKRDIHTHALNITEINPKIWRNRAKSKVKRDGEQDQVQCTSPTFVSTFSFPISTYNLYVCIAFFVARGRVKGRDRQRHHLLHSKPFCCCYCCCCTLIMRRLQTKTSKGEKRERENVRMWGIFRSTASVCVCFHILQHSRMCTHEYKHRA